MVAWVRVVAGEMERSGQVNRAAEEVKQTEFGRISDSGNFTVVGAEEWTGGAGWGEGDVTGLAVATLSPCPPNVQRPP